MHITDLLELDSLSKEEARRYPEKRGFYSKLIAEQGKHFIGIVGARGTGKTILLKQLALHSKNAVYFSLDSLEEGDLFEVVKKLHVDYAIKLFLLDEIHVQKDYDKKLKKIFDFLDVRVIFTSSVSLSLFESSYDLSRRVKLLTLYPFSFREYIFFKKGIMLPPLTVEDILDKNWEPEHLRYEFLFDAYLQGGLLPFSLEEPDVFPLLKNIVQKVIAKDIPSVASLKTEELSAIEKTLAFIGKSSVDGINYSSVSRNIGITKYKAASYLGLLEKAFLLHQVFPKGTNVLQEPKILLSLPLRLLYQGVDQAIGAMREDFFAETMRMKAVPFYYLKTTRGAKTPDFLLQLDSGEKVVEVGGKGKGREQFKGISLKKRLILTYPSTMEGIKRPLFLLGFI